MKSEIGLGSCFTFRFKIYPIEEEQEEMNEIELDA